MVSKAKKAPKRRAAKSKAHGTPPPSSLVEEQLARYRAMRDFNQTAEPSGQASTVADAGPLPFVIQKHAATRLHYDFRLGLHGVLKSWAVTKGPSYVPGDKRLAVQVEDHPMEYGGFEGTIPKGQYGGGTVMLWDEGTWEPVGNPDEGLAKGNLKFVLHGQKLQGKWVLVRMGGKAANEAKPNWLLIKEHDEHEKTADDQPITEEAPNSVLTQRDMDAIARDEDHIWQSNRPRPRCPAIKKLCLPSSLRS
jgi:bifunctional non-homologous end joining protein LigD